MFQPAVKAGRVEVDDGDAGQRQRVARDTRTHGAAASDGAICWRATVRSAPMRATAKVLRLRREFWLPSPRSQLAEVSRVRLGTCGSS